MKTSKFALLSVMLCFFTMGFVDLVGIASNYVQQDLGLTHAQANIMPRSSSSGSLSSPCRRVC